MLEEIHNVSYSVSMLGLYDPDKIDRIWEMNIFEFIKLLCYKKYSNFVEAIYIKRKRPNQNNSEF